MSNRRSISAMAALAFSALLAAVNPLYAQPAPTSTTPLIARASVDLITDQLLIQGLRLAPTSGPPVVQVGNTILSVLSYSSSQITATFPASLASLGGNFLLIVTANGVTGFDLTVGAIGLQGPPGPAGPQGPSGTLTLPFNGTVASSFGPALIIDNTAGAGILGEGTSGPGVIGLGGVLGGAGTIGVTGVGGGASGTATGGSGVSGTGGLGTEVGGNGLTGTGGLSGSTSGGNGVAATGGQCPDGIGGDGGYFVGAVGCFGGRGVYGVGAGGGSCSIPGAGAGGYFVGGGFAGDGLNGGDGVRGYPGSDFGVGIFATSAQASDGGASTIAGLFNGDVQVFGNLTKSGGSFQIDDPLDPANKYLYHSFVESPDMMNIYNGNVTTNGSGIAVVTLPDWFDSLNSDFRYQLTVVGQFAQAIVASKVHDNSFSIKTDKPNVEVSWQVTGIRQDAWAAAHRIPVEVEKAKVDQGHYLHPELFEHKGEPSISELHHPRLPAGPQH